MEFLAYRQSEVLREVTVLRQIGLDLPPEHPIRKRLESAPVVDVSFEEIAQVLRGGVTVLRQIGLDLPPEHPIHKRLESAPVVDVSFEEIAHLPGSKGAGGAAEELVKLRNRLSWIERFAQLAIYLGIFGTVLALVMSDTTDLTAFRSQLPTALSTTFIGLLGAIVLSVLSGVVESRIEVAALRGRDRFDGES